MVLTRNGYRPRLVDSKLDLMLQSFGAVCVEGPKSCGKTWVSLNHSESALMIGDPSGNFQNRTKVKIDIYSAFKGSEPHLIDEWQEIPALWDATKYVVDESNKMGRFILTGSSTPVTKGVFHSGAGRIGSLRMTTMSLFESGDSNGDVSLRSLFESTFDGMSDENVVSLEKLIYLTVRGGWPRNIGLDGTRASLSLHGYIDTIIKDACALDGSFYDKKKMSMVIRSLARNESTLTPISTLTSDVSDPRDATVDNKTITRYLDVLNRMFLLNDQPAFSPNFRSSARIGKRSKRHFVDPSIAVAAMDLTEKKLMNDLNTFGFLFEALCERDLGIYADAIGGRLYHYRDDVGHEIDAIVELDDGRWGAFEIKLGTYQIDEAAEKLIKIRDWMASKDAKLPTFLCVICGMSSYAYRRPDDVYVVPITSLRD